MTFRPPPNAEKRKRTKNKKSRTEVSSSESDSEVEQRKIRKVKALAEEEATVQDAGMKKAKKKEKKRSGESAPAQDDIVVEQEDEPTTTKKSKKKKKKSSSPSAPANVVSTIDQDDVLPAEPGLTKAKKQKKNKPLASQPSPAPAPTDDISMPDRSVSPLEEPVPAPEAKSEPEVDVFGNIYLKRVATELADDLDKVREANDFTNRSLPMLIHALKQGSTVYSPEERRRVIGVVGVGA